MDSRIASLVEAAKAGNAQALTELAHVQAVGFLAPRNFEIALNNLERAAAATYAPALAELRVLARAEGRSAEKLKAKVDLPALRRAPKPRVLLEQPRVRVFDGFARPEECDWLIARCRHRLHAAQVYEQSASELSQNAGRSNTEASYELDASDLVLSVVQDRIARATAVPVENFEVAKLLHYNPGEAFLPHHDFLQPGMQAEIEQHGQRVATFLLYLDDQYEGGETEFCESGIKFKARKGDALFFFNVDGNGAPDPASLHAGLPPTSGEKWLFSLWLRGKTVNAYQTPRVERTALPPAWYRGA
ncbi:MAG: 2OG-Fe(II) oxygenase [Terricaulis sp.]